MRALHIAITALTIMVVTGCASMGDGSKASKRQAIHAVQAKTLSHLYAQKPDTEAQIKNAEGYAVFSNANVNLLFVSAGTGYGIVNNNKEDYHAIANLTQAPSTCPSPQRSRAAASRRIRKSLFARATSQYCLAPAQSWR